MKMEIHRQVDLPGFLDFSQPLVPVSPRFRMPAKASNQLHIQLGFDAKMTHVGTLAPRYAWV